MNEGYWDGFFAAGNRSDRCLVVEAYPFRRGLGTQHSVYSRCCCCAIHDRDPCVPAWFGSQVHPWRQIAWARYQQGSEFNFPGDGVPRCIRPFGED